MPVSKTELNSALTCPHCGYRKQEIMPTIACQFFYKCEGCSAVFKPKFGDCCVFCSYGSIKCPPVQEQKGCCG
jgi:hypothetical protein